MAARRAQSVRLPSIAIIALAAAILLLRPPGAAKAQASGDVNCDGRIDAADVGALVPTLFGDFGAECTVGEVNADGRISAADVAAAALAIAALPASGAEISFLGIAAPNGAALSALGTIGETPVFFRNAGTGFRIVVEAARGLNQVLPGRKTFDFDPTNPNRRPDLQVGCTTALGDGSLGICEDGVPAIPAPHFGGSQKVADTLNDLACNFDVITSPRFACTIDRFQAPNFLGNVSELQFCLQVTNRLQFPPGDTRCSVRLRDEGGTLGPLRQFILRVGSGPVPPTFTATAQATVTPSATLRPTGTPTSSRTPVRSATPSPTRDVPTASPTSSATPTSTTAAPTPTTPGVATATAPVAGTATTSPTRTRTRTPTRSQTPTLTPTRTLSPTPVATASPTRSATPSSPQGPVVTFIGLAQANDELIQPSGMTPGGVPIYTRTFGSGFRIVVEGGVGPSFENVGVSSFSFGGFAFPDLQVQANQPLGDGSAAICDTAGATAGGVPAIHPPSFQETPHILGAVNDFGCRFVDGAGAFRGRQASADSCVQNPPDSGVFNFVHPNTRVQFCALVDLALAFPRGETLITARLRDELGNVGQLQQMVVRILQ